MASTVAAGLGGILLARTVGPSVRGEYAAITAWFGVALMVGGMGQPAALCFYVAHDPARAPEYVATSRAMMLVTGGLALTGGILLAPVPAHGRAAAARHDLGAAMDRLHLAPPVDHRTFLGLARHARLIVSDSGGVQEECTVLKRPLVVVRNSTERPEAIEAGFAHLVQPGPALGDISRRLLADTGLDQRLAALACPYGDGRASERITACLRRFLRPNGPGEK
ncbi:MAG: UDP-N-acetylglucosamine 2-epimerase [Streptosporangiaceae bacterium]